MRKYFFIEIHQIPAGFQWIPVCSTRNFWYPTRICGAVWHSASRLMRQNLQHWMLSAQSLCKARSSSMSHGRQHLQSQWIWLPYQPLCKIPKVPTSLHHYFQPKGQLKLDGQPSKSQYNQSPSFRHQILKTIGPASPSHSSSTSFRQAGEKSVAGLSLGGGLDSSISYQWPGQNLRRTIIMYRFWLGWNQYSNLWTAAPRTSTLQLRHIVHIVS